MYVVPFALFRHALGEAADQLRPESAVEGTVEVPLALFRRLLQLVLDRHFNDEAGYLSANPDVASAVRRGEVADGREHFVRHGYFEGRAYPGFAVDEAVYLKKNPDVARSVKAGIFVSGQAHYESVGMQEFRVPSLEAEDDLRLWRDFLRVVSDRVREAAD